MAFGSLWCYGSGRGLSPLRSPPSLQVTETEAEASSLQLSLDRLNLSLAKAVEAESSLQEKVQALTASLSQSHSSAASAQEKALQLQKALTASEHDRRVLQVGGWGWGWGTGCVWAAEFPLRLWQSHSAPRHLACAGASGGRCAGCQPLRPLCQLRSVWTRPARLFPKPRSKTGPLRRNSSP